MEAKIAQMAAENIRIAEEERRKTLGEETKHAKHVKILIFFFHSLSFLARRLSRSACP